MGDNAPNIIIIMMASHVSWTSRFKASGWGKLSNVTFLNFQSTYFSYDIIKLAMSCKLLANLKN